MGVSLNCASYFSEFNVEEIFLFALWAPEKLEKAVLSCELYSKIVLKLSLPFSTAVEYV